jgi:hypothetical protein
LRVQSKPDGSYGLVAYDVYLPKCIAGRALFEDRAVESRCLVYRTVGKRVMSLDAFVTAVRSTFSKAQWSKYHNGQAPLNRTMRNELRTAVGLPLLPPTLAEVNAGR